MGLSLRKQTCKDGLVTLTLQSTVHPGHVAWVRNGPFLLQAPLAYGLSSMSQLLLSERGEDKGFFKLKDLPLSLSLGE